LVTIIRLGILLMSHFSSLAGRRAFLEAAGPWELCWWRHLVVLWPHRWRGTTGWWRRCWGGLCWGRWQLETSSQSCVICKAKIHRMASSFACQKFFSSTASSFSSLSQASSSGSPVEVSSNSDPAAKFSNSTLRDLIFSITLRFSSYRTAMSWLSQDNANASSWKHSPKSRLLQFAQTAILDQLVLRLTPLLVTH